MKKISEITLEDVQAVLRIYLQTIAPDSILRKNPDMNSEEERLWPKIKSRLQEAWIKRESQLTIASIKHSDFLENRLISYKWPSRWMHASRLKITLDDNDYVIFSYRMGDKLSQEMTEAIESFNSQINEYFA